MTVRQDDTHPTGVAPDPSDPYVITAVERKEDAALGLLLGNPRMSWGQIAAALGYPTPRAAKAAFERAWARRVKDDKATKEWLRQMASHQMDALVSSVMVKALDQTHPEHLAAVGRAREVIQDQVRLFGLNAPAEVAVAITPTTEELANWVAMMKGSEEIIESDIFSDVQDAEVVEPEAIEASIPASEIEF